MTLCTPFSLWLLLGVRLAYCLLELPVYSQHAGLHRRSTLRPRQSQELVEAEISYDQDFDWYGGYFIDLTIGTPPQRQTVKISTTTSDTYFNSITSTTCDVSRYCLGGSFNSSASATFQRLAQSPAFNLTQPDGRRIIGPIVSDTVGIGQRYFEDLQFGVGEFVAENQYAYGILGVGYPTAVNGTDNDSWSPFMNLPEILVRANASASRLFSIAVGRKESEGSIVFGGIDSTRYTGELATIDLINVTKPYVGIDGKSTTAIRNFIITITQAEYITGNDTQVLWSSGSHGPEAWDSDDSAVPVSPSTGSAMMRLPSEHYNRYIAPRFPFLDSDGTCICDYADTDDRLALTFADKIKIEVDVKDLLKPLYDVPMGEPYRYSNGTDRCWLHIRDGGPKVRGDTNTLYAMAEPVLSSMYLVFDPDNNQISIAQAVTEVAKTSNITAIEAGPSGVAKAVGSANPSPSPSGGGSSPPGTNIPAPDPPGPTNNTGAIAGGVVGGVGGLALIGGAAYFLMQRRKTKTQPMSEIQNDFGQDFEGTYVQQPKNPRYNGDPTLE